MANWQQEEKVDTPQRYVSIHCFTCGKAAANKQDVRKNHIGHDVHYVDKRGNIDE